MENILILDTETTGLDPKKDKIIEIAGILYNVPTKTVLSQIAYLNYAESNEAYEINKIPPEALKILSANAHHYLFQAFARMYQYADLIMAHNAEFDKAFVYNNEDIAKLDKKWICSKNDVIWPIPKSSPLNLIHISVALGVPVISAHRAITDCILLSNCLGKVDDLHQFLEDGLNRKMYQALVSYDAREEAKKAGFQWNPEKKIWYRKLLPQEANALNFSIKLIGD